MKKKKKFPAMMKENNLKNASKRQKTRLAVLFGELLAMLEEPLDKANPVY